MLKYFFNTTRKGLVIGNTPNSENIRPDNHYYYTHEHRKLMTGGINNLVIKKTMEHIQIYIYVMCILL